MCTNHRAVIWETKTYQLKMQSPFRLPPTFLILFAVALTLQSCGCGGKQPPTEPPLPVVRKATLLFGGDLMQHTPQIEASRSDTTYDYAETFQYIKPLFDSTDFVVLNFETTVSANKRYTGYPLFSAPSALLGNLKEYGVDAVMFANNHICDKGAKGIESTIDKADNVGLKHTGAFRDSSDYEQNNPLLFEIDSISFALLNYTYGTNGMPIPQGKIVNQIDTIQMAADLQKIAPSTDYTIIFLHWGVEYAKQPSAQQRELAEWCHKRGVDFVIGSHPHVIQPAESHRDSLGRAEQITVYSLGNLVSNQRWRRSDGGLLFRIAITHQDSLPPQIEANYMLTWVYNPVVEGKRRYIILPTTVADTLLKEQTAAKAAYDLFVSDSRKLMSSDTTIWEFF